MKSTVTFSLATVILVFAVLGCGFNPFGGKTQTNTASNKSLTDQGVDNVIGEDKLGVAECDEVMDLLTAEMNNPDDNFVVKAGKGLVFNRIKQGIKDSLEKNKNDKVELAKTCKEFKKELDKAKTEMNKGK